MESRYILAQTLRRITRNVVAARKVRQPRRSEYDRLYSRSDLYFGDCHDPQRVSQLPVARQVAPSSALYARHLSRFNGRAYSRKGKTVGIK